MPTWEEAFADGPKAKDRPKGASWEEAFSAPPPAKPETAKAPDPAATAKAMADESGSPFGGGQLEASLRGGLDAATYGTFDEMTGIMAGVGSFLHGKGYTKARDEASERTRRINEAFSAAYPKTTIVSGIGGSLATAPLLPGMGAARAGAAVGRMIGPGVVSRLANAAVQGGVGGAVGGAAYGAGSAEGGILDRARGAVEGGVEGGILGGGIGVAAHGIGAGARGLGFGRAAEAPVIPNIADAAGNLTPEAAQAIRMHGIEPNDISRPVATQTASELAGTRSNPTDVAATLRTVIARKHKVDLPSAQARQDQAGVATLQRAQAGAMGEPAQRMAENAAMLQRQQFDKAAGDVAQKVAPHARAGYGESGTGGMVAEGVNKRADAAWQDVKQLYRQTGTDQHMVTAAETKDLLPTVKKALDAEHLSGITEGVPGYKNAMQTLQNSIVDNNISFADADEIRKVLGRLSRNAADETDKYKIDTTIKAYDDWLDGVANSRASTLPADSLAALKKARAGARDWFQKFQRDPANRGDKAGQLVEAVRKGNLEDQALFNRLMGSATGFDEGAVKAASKVRDILGEPSPEWQTVKLGMFRRIAYGDANKQAVDLQPGEQAWRTMDTRIGQAIDGTGAKLAREMLGDDAVAELRELREIARASTVKPKAGNPPGSGYEVERAKTARRERLATALKWAGGPAGTALGGAVFGLPGGVAGLAIGGPVGLAAEHILRGNNLSEIKTLLAPHRAPALRPAGPRLPTLPIEAAGVAGGAAFDRWRREHR